MAFPALGRADHNSAGKLHCVRLAGLRDRHGRGILVHESAFVPCEVSVNDLLP